MMARRDGIRTNQLLMLYADYGFSTVPTTLSTTTDSGTHPPPDTHRPSGIPHPHTIYAPL